MIGRLAGRWRIRLRLSLEAALQLKEDSFKFMPHVTECCGHHERIAGSCSRMCLGFNARHCVHHLTYLCMYNNSAAVWVYD